jgi:hypothetical protein
MTILLIVVVVILLAGGGYGYRAGYVGTSNPMGIVLLLLIVLLLIGAFGGPRWGLW